MICLILFCFRTLRCNVGERERAIHGLLRLEVSCGREVAAVVAAMQVVVVGGREERVFARRRVEHRARAVAARLRSGCGGASLQPFARPARSAGASIEQHRQLTVVEERCRHCRRADARQRRHQRHRIGERRSPIAVDAVDAARASR